MAQLKITSENWRKDKRTLELSDDDGTGAYFMVDKAGWKEARRKAISSLQASTIAADAIVSGSVARSIGASLGDTLSVKAMGAVGDGTTDDTAAINAALLASRRVYVPPGTYLVTTIMVPSLTTFAGAGEGATIIKSVGDAPIVVSRNYVSSTGASTSGRTIIRDMTILGSANIAHTAQHGVILRDYYSTLRDLKFQDIGASAIKMTHLNDAAQSVGGTLVQNRMFNIQCTDIYGAVAIECGSDNNGKITDGVAYDIDLDHAGSSSQIGFFVGSSAGWKVTGIHTYGGNVPAEAIKMRFCDRTVVRSCYIESYLTNALLVHAASGASCFVDEIIALAADAAHDSRVVQCEAGSGNPVYQVGRVHVHKSATGNFTRAIAAAGGAVVTSEQTPVKTGVNASTITSYSVSSGSTLIGDREVIVADAGDAAYSGLNATTTSDVGTVIYNTPLNTANRAVSLPTNGLYAGLRYTIIRTANCTGAFNVTIGTGPVKSLTTAGTWARMLYNGTSWICEASGTS
jgi:hypothetical protein